MRKFLRAAFNITPFQILLILVLVVIKFALIEFNFVDRIQTPFLIVLLSSAILFLFAVGIKGHIENKGEAFETWVEKDRPSMIKKLLVSFVTLSLSIPVVIFYLLFLYVATPTSKVLFFGLLVGILINNSYEFFKKNNTIPKDDRN